jgi:hypothetical protein
MLLAIQQNLPRLSRGIELGTAQSVKKRSLVKGIALKFMPLR